MLLIKNGRILTMAGYNYDSGSILINNGKIVQVGKEIDVEEDSVSEIIDASDCWVLPGLIEAHCHIGITEEKKGFEGDDCNEATEPITPYIRSLDAINPMDSAFHNAISSGITYVMPDPRSSDIVGGRFKLKMIQGRLNDLQAMSHRAPRQIHLSVRQINS